MTGPRAWARLGQSVMGTPPAEGTTRNPRAGLVAAGALVVAVAGLQIAQGAISAFSPRPVIQAALVVGVGLAALAAELVRTGEPSTRNVAIGAGVGCVVSLGAGLVIAIASGFSPPDPEPVGAQVARARKGLVRQGLEIVAFRRVRLHEGAVSYLFVVRRTSARGPADSVRIFDDAGGHLRPALTLAPRVASGNVGLHTRFHLTTIRDLDGDGQPEILGSFDTNEAGEEFQRVPVLIAHASAADRYVVTPLLRTSALDPAARAGLPTYRFAAGAGRLAPSAWVGDLAVDDGHVFLPDGVTLATTVVPRNEPSPVFDLAVVPPGGSADFPVHVRFWRLVTDGGRARLRPLCLRGAHGATVVRSRGAGSFLDRPPARARLAAGMEATGVRLGEFGQGRCLEAGS